ncbi:MAG: hypothetical protein E6Q68_06805 [Polynucleobacter sp.]|nr:MAG: hypothetical protein E6Q68_06805 [Polynucleobacter sp.]
MEEIDNKNVDSTIGFADISKLNKKQLRFVEKIASTKFVLVFLTIVASIVLLWVGKLPPNIFSEIVQWTVSAYILGNAFIQSKWGK